MNINFLYVLLLFIIASSFNLSAQSLRYEYIHAQYLQLPTHPLNKDYKTYSVEVQSAENVLKELQLSTEDIVQKYYHFDAFTRLPEQADLSIKLEIENYKLDELMEKEKIVTLKDESKTKVTTHYLEIPYHFPFHLTFFDNVANKRLTEYSSTSVKMITYGRLNKYQSVNELRAAWEKEKTEFIKDALRKQLLLFIQQSSDVLDKKHDYQHASQKVTIFKVSKKSDHSEQFEKAYQITESAFSAMRPDLPLDTIAATLQEALDIWKNLVDAYPTKEKKSERVRQGCLMNLAQIYYWLDDMEKAEWYNNEAAKIKNTGFEGFPKSLETSIIATKKLMDTNNCSTRHHPIDMTSKPK